MVSNDFYFHPYLGKWSNLTHIFQMNWNHHLDKPFISTYSQSRPMKCDEMWWISPWYNGRFLNWTNRWNQATWLTTFKFDTPRGRVAITGAGGFLGQLARAECEDLFGTDLWGIGGKLLHVLYLLEIVILHRKCWSLRFFSFGHLDTAPSLLSFGHLEI